MTHSHSVIERQSATVGSQRGAAANVGALLHERFELGERELQQHLDDSRWLWRTAYARFEAHGAPADRDEARALLAVQNDALRARTPAMEDAERAELQDVIDGGVGYFCWAGDRDRINGAYGT